MTNRFQNIILKVDSSETDLYLNDYKTHFKYTFDAISVSHDEQIIYSLVSAVIPYSFYSVNEYNNMLDLVIFKNNHGAITSENIFIEIENGNYSSNEYARELTQLLNAKNSLHAIFNITYKRIQNKFLIEVDANTTVNLLFKTGEHNKNSCHNFLGFEKENITILTNVFSNKCANMNEISYFHLKSDLGNNVLSSDNSDNILEIIPMPAIPNSFINYNPVEQNKYLLQSKSISSISFDLQDNFHRSINLNGCSFYLTLKFEIIKNDDYTDIKDPRKLPEQEKTNIEMITENPMIIGTSSPMAPISMKEYIQLENMREMIDKLLIEEQKLKNKKKVK